MKRLTLRNFRNYEAESLAFFGLLNIVTGANAQGKTNLLEALIVLATGRSHRTTRDQELIRWGAEEARVEAVVERAHGPVRIEVQFSTAAPKRFFVNGQPVRQRADLFGNLNVVAFTPDDLQLVKGSPTERRRFLDVEIAQVSASYRHRLSRYHRVLQQRNAVLREIAERRLAVSQLGPWDELLVTHGVPIMAKRAEMVASLSRWAREIHGRITQGRERLQVIYEPFFLRDREEGFAKRQEWHAGAWEDPAFIRREFEAALREAAPLERRRGMSLVGPQRDDVRFEIDGRDVRIFGSQGQQRTTVLACKLAEIAYMEEEVGEPPILLLDDVMSELDGSRRAFLVESVQDRVQTWITSAHLGDIDERLVTHAAVFHVREGKITP